MPTIFEADQDGQYKRIRHLTTLMLAAAAAHQWGVVGRLRAERARRLDMLGRGRDDGILTAA